MRISNAEIFFPLTIGKIKKVSVKALKILKINFETNIVSAHRTPKRMFEYAKNAEKNNISVIIAGAGGSAHLPGMVAAITRIPVIGVPIESIRHEPDESLDVDATIIIGKDINTFTEVFAYISSVK